MSFPVFNEFQEFSSFIWDCRNVHINVCHWKEKHSKAETNVDGYTDTSVFRVGRGWIWGYWKFLTEMLRAKNAET